MESRWAGRTFGSRGMHRSLISILKVVDVRLVYIFTFIFIVPVCVLFCRSGRSSYLFFRKGMGYGRLKSIASAFSNHAAFAQVVIDRFAMYAGRKFDIQISGTDHFREKVEKGEGFLNFSSHIGNYEIAGYSLVSGKKKIHAVVFSNEKEAVTEGRGNLFGKTNINMIGLKQDMSHLFEIDRALCDGDIVSFPADRYLPGSRCIEGIFLGKKAKFPQGPFSVATMRGLDVLAVNVIKTGWTKYSIFIAPLKYDRNAPRKVMEAQLLDSYTSELGRMVKMFPAQWYNFYDFWA